jgi:hypothetical protein
MAGGGDYEVKKTVRHELEKYVRSDEFMSSISDAIHSAVTANLKDHPAVKRLSEVLTDSTDVAAPIVVVPEPPESRYEIVIEPVVGKSSTTSEEVPDVGTRTPAVPVPSNVAVPVPSNVTVPVPSNVTVPFVQPRPAPAEPAKSPGPCLKDIFIDSEVPDISDCMRFDEDFEIDRYVQRRDGDQLKPKPRCCRLGQEINEIWTESERNGTTFQGKLDLCTYGLYQICKVCYSKLDAAGEYEKLSDRFGPTYNAVFEDILKTVKRRRGEKLSAILGYLNNKSRDRPTYEIRRGTTYTIGQNSSERTVSF